MTDGAVTGAAGASKWALTHAAFSAVPSSVAAICSTASTLVAPRIFWPIWLTSASRRAAAPWLCGYVREADCHRYSAHNFYGEIKRYFRWLGGMPRNNELQRKETK